MRIIYSFVAVVLISVQVFAVQASQGVQSGQEGQAAQVGKSTQTGKSTQAGKVIDGLSDIPLELLELDKNRCMQGCLGGFKNKVCEQLCDCSVKGFQQYFSYETYIDLSMQLSRNELSPENRKKMDKIAKFCAAEIPAESLVNKETAGQKGKESSADKPE